jgi:hypothetical protein
MVPTSTGGKYVAALAMMMGVLVIAFPVSVFSELWSQELRELKGFDHIADVTASANNSTAPENLHDAHGEDDDNSSNHRSNFNNNTDGQVLLDQESMLEILECLDIIREREQRIRTLLQRSTISSH